MWPHPAAGGDGPDAGWVPFHKLSQWLAYSLLEPFEWAGVQVHEVDALTGLPEYRNGGLLLDAGVIVPRDANFAQHAVQAGRRLDHRVARADREPARRAGAAGADACSRVDEAAFPLARLLEGGTWAAGRAIAAERRDGGVAAGGGRQRRHGVLSTAAIATTAYQRGACLEFQRP